MVTLLVLLSASSSSSTSSTTSTINDASNESFFPSVDEQWWHSVWCFLAGAGLVAFLWALQTLRNLLPDEISADDMSWVDPWNTLKEKSWKVIVENSEFYYYNHIGELPRPKQRRHWPWETIGRKVFANNNNNININIQTSDSNSDRKKDNISRQSSFETASLGDLDDIGDNYDGDGCDDNNKNPGRPEVDFNASQATMNRVDEDPSSREDEICIGSIFGLDVGGTLAKLVYFEQKPPDYDPLVNASRERQYALAASAQAVLMARTSWSPSNVHAITTNTMTTTSSTCRLTGETKGRFGAHSTTPRRRSLNLGSLGRFKDLQKQMCELESTERDDEPFPLGNLPTTPLGQKRRRQRHSIRPMHSVASQIELNKLKNLRQESVPDDLSLYRTAVHFKATDPALQPRDTKNLDSNDDLSDAEEKKSVETELTDSASTMKKSRSMFNLSFSQKKAVALDRFYSFARRLDSYENSVRDHRLSFFSRELGGEFHFLHFESRWMNHAMDLIRYHNLHLNIAKMGATGGGAHKYAKVWEKMLGIRMDKQDELDSLVAGMQFVLSTVVGECYTFRPHEKKKHPSSPRDVTPPSRATSSVSTADSANSETGSDQVGAPLTDESDDDVSEPSPPKPKRYIRSGSIHSPRRPKQKEQQESSTSSNNETTNKAKIDDWWWSRKVQRDAISYSKSYPYMLVTIGTGVSILRVDGPRKHERISGSTIGGGTYWGLIRLLTDVEDFEDVMRLAEKGDPAKVDMMVGDIYGENSDALEKLGLPSNVVASSFGKLVAKEDPAAGLEQEDLARALLLMITNNIGQVAYLNAKLHNTPRIYFVGNFLRNNIISQRRLSYAIDYWSKGEMEALFLEHEGYFGALGAFLMSQKIAHDEEGFFQWGEDGAPSDGHGSNEDIGHHPERNPNHFMHRRTTTFGA